jgi:hypothetical protein
MTNIAWLFRLQILRKEEETSDQNWNNPLPGNSNHAEFTKQQGTLRRLELYAGNKRQNR